MANANATGTKPAWNQDFELLRGLAICAVVLIHACSVQLVRTQSPVSLEEFILAAIHRLSGFAVPAFLLLSGYFYYSSLEKAKNPVAVFWRRIIRILPGYLSFSIIFYLFYTRLYFQPVLKSPTGFLIKLLEGSALEIYYFIPLILLLYLLGLFVFQAFKENILGIFLFFTVLQGVIVYDNYTDVLKALPIFNGLVVGKLLDFFLNLSPFFILGMHWGKNAAQYQAFVRQKGSLLLGLSVLTYLLALGEFQFLLQMVRNGDFRAVLNPLVKQIFVICYVYFIIFYASSGVLSKLSKLPFLKEISHYSYGIYLMHFPVLDYVERFTYQFTNKLERSLKFRLPEIGVFPKTILISLLCILICTLFFRLIDKKIPRLRIWVGL